MITSTSTWEDPLHRHFLSFPLKQNVSSASSLFPSYSHPLLALYLDKNMNESVVQASHMIRENERFFYCFRGEFIKKVSGAKLFLIRKNRPWNSPKSATIIMHLNSKSDFLWIACHFLKGKKVVFFVEGFCNCLTRKMARHPILWSFYPKIPHLGAIL